MKILEIVTLLFSCFSQMQTFTIHAKKIEILQSHRRLNGSILAVNRNKWKNYLRTNVSLLADAVEEP